MPANNKNWRETSGYPTYDDPNYIPPKTGASFQSGTGVNKYGVSNSVKPVTNYYDNDAASAAARTKLSPEKSNNDPNTTNISGPANNTYTMSTMDNTITTPTPTSNSGNTNTDRSTVFDRFGSQALDSFKPVYNDYFSQARNELNPQDEVRKAQSDVWQGFQRSTEAGLRDLSRAGVNLYSGRALDTIKDISNERAKALAFGSQAARQQVQDKQFERLGSAMTAGSDLTKTVFTTQAGVEEGTANREVTTSEGELNREFQKEMMLTGYANDAEVTETQHQFEKMMTEAGWNVEKEMFYSGQSTEMFKFMTQLGFDYDKLDFLANEGALDRAADYALGKLQSDTAITTTNIDALSRVQQESIRSATALKVSELDNTTKMNIAALDNIIQEKRLFLEDKNITLDHLLGIETIKVGQENVIIDSNTKLAVSANDLAGKLAAVKAGFDAEVMKNITANKKIETDASKPIILHAGDKGFNPYTGELQIDNIQSTSAGDAFQQALGQMFGNSKPGEILDIAEAGLGLIIKGADGIAHYFQSDSGSKIDIDEISGIMHNSDGTYSYQYNVYGGTSGDIAEGNTGEPLVGPLA